MNRTNSFSCTCPPGVTGMFCQIDLDECLSNYLTKFFFVNFFINTFDLTGYPCFNNGKCFQPSIGQWACNCSKCFTGSRCEALITTCTNTTCSENGYCVELGPCQSGCLCKEGKLNESNLFFLFTKNEFRIYRLVM